jgi:hypothetical protein
MDSSAFAASSSAQNNAKPSKSTSKLIKTTNTTSTTPKLQRITQNKSDQTLRKQAARRSLQERAKSKRRN